MFFIQLNLYFLTVRILKNKIIQGNYFEQKGIKTGGGLFTYIAYYTLYNSMVVVSLSMKVKQIQTFKK